MEPFSAAIGVSPSLEVDTGGVVAEKQVGFEILVAGIGTVTGDVGLTTADEFSLVGLGAAARASQSKHE